MPDPAPTARDEQSRRYEEAVAAFGPALDRLAVAYERDAERRKDLLQDIHFALWRSLATFDSRCALRTWVYRVAHNVAASHALRDHRRARECVGLDALEAASMAFDEDTMSSRLVEQLDDDRRRAQLAALIAQLIAPDRQLLLLYLEELNATAIGEVMGLSPANVATKIHRLKRVLARRALADRVPTPSQAAPVALPTAATSPSAPK
ncbi:sigma-70 family RNA polymerase sigma factor [Gemmatimonas sp.]|uniref:RNA polymerase sigma factor n=1 Tax=Gemmatimonas sp. TaxID=1962908 RepID=UPI00286D4287|nr:sigma-70 family RNA polymerase sigma factor [Gemmatimonas sp.]